MTTALLIIHLFVTLALIAVVLVQRSEGGGLGVGTSQGMGSFMSGRGTANLLTRTTAVLAALFFALSLALALLNRGTTVGSASTILDNPPPGRAAPASPADGGPPANGTPASKPSALVPPVTPAPAAPAPTPAAPAPAAPESAAPAAPSSPPAPVGSTP